MPSTMWGIGSVPVASIEACAVCGSIRIAERTITTPRSNGPTRAESIATTEKEEPR